MRTYLIALFFLLTTAAVAQEDFAFAPNRFYSDAIVPVLSSAASFVRAEFAGFNLLSLIAEGKATKKLLGYSKKGKPIAVYYFPGISSRKALVIGGVHGSELSAVEVAKEVINNLSKGEKPYYSVMVIPMLFPDNATTAETCKGDRVNKNAGRYTTDYAIDPNRQMPSLGKPFSLSNPLDAYGREIEKENRLLLQLIQAFAPDRIINLHAIKDAQRAGVYADPRTDCEGRALGFSSDSSLALLMAAYIEENGGASPGNNVRTSPTALYYLDPKPTAAGQLQPRNLSGMNPQGKISGVSLGGWASTAVCDDATNYSRPAMRLFTMEFPGYKKPSEYCLQKDREWFSKEVELYAGSICKYFLQNYFTEEATSDENSLAQK